MRIGGTPVVFLEKLGVYLKLEEKNPTGSVKDRPVFFMFMKALMEGKLDGNRWLVEPTSGNTGMAMAMLGARYGVKVVVVAPESISRRKIDMVKEYGGDVVLTPADKGMAGAVEVAKGMVEEGRAVMLDQFNNPYNVLAHELTTGPEILHQMDYRIDAFVCGVGTGGTLTGVSRVLRRFFGDRIRIFAVEPAESPVLSGGEAGKHGIEGIGAGFVPSILDLNLVDEVFKVRTEDALDMREKMARIEGISVGISTGANVFAALEIKRIHGLDRILTMEMDGGIRYV